MKTLKHSEQRLVFLEDLARQTNHEISLMHQSIVQKSVLPEARSFADKNLPAYDEHEIAPYLTSITGQYKALKKEVSLKMQGRLQKFLGVVDITPMNEKIEELKNRINKENAKINNLETDKSRICNNQGHTAYKQYTWLLFLFGLAESLLTMSCFLKIGDIVLIALILGVVVGLAQVYAAKTIVLFIRELEDPRKRARYYKIAFLSFAVFSLVLGTLRYYIAHNGAAADIPFIILNPFSFAAINLLLIIASALLVYFFFPTKTEMKELARAEEITRDIKNGMSAKKDLEIKLGAVIAERTETIKIHGKLAHVENELFGKIDAFYDEAVGKFKHENVVKRTDGAFPPCFRNRHEILPGSTHANSFIQNTQ